jgi:hypothetical protein
VQSRIVTGIAIRSDSDSQAGREEDGEEGRRFSQISGVTWDRRYNKWRARLGKWSKGSEVWLGYHATKEAAAQAIVQYKQDGVAPGDAARPATSKFKGVNWEKSSGKWRARCKKIGLGYHTKEEDAARAYNIEAERIGLIDRNVIPPAGNDDEGSNTDAAAPTAAAVAATAAAAAATAAPAVLSPAAAAHVHTGTGSKRSALTPPPASHTTKQMRLDCSVGAAAGARAAAAVAAQVAALEARIKVTKAKTGLAERQLAAAAAAAAVAEARLAVHVAEQEAAEAERHAAALSA